MIVSLAIVTPSPDRPGDEWRFRAATDVDGVIRTELVEAEDTTVHATSGAVNGVIDVGAALILAFHHLGDLSGVSIACGRGLGPWPDHLLGDAP